MCKCPLTAGKQRVKKNLDRVPAQLLITPETSQRGGWTMNSLGGQHITSDCCTCTTLCPVRLKTSLTCGSVPPASPPQPHGRASRRLWRASANTSAKGGSVPSRSSAISRPRLAGRPQPTFPPSGGLRTDALSPGVAQELQAHWRPPGGGSPSGEDGEPAAACLVAGVGPAGRAAAAQNWVRRWREAWALAVAIQLATCSTVIGVWTLRVLPNAEGEFTGKGNTVVEALTCG